MMLNAPQSKILQRFSESPWLPGALVLLVLLVIYSLTLQTDINGSQHEYTADSGELQVALNLWGSLHYTGYPQFTILSALLATLFRWLGFTPAAAATLPSLVWSLAGLAFFYWIFRRLSGDGWLAGGAILTLGLMETFWVHSVVAEVYSFSVLLTGMFLWLALRLNERWHDRDWFLMLFIMGNSAAHHRLLIFILPAAILLAWPNLPRQRLLQPRWLTLSLAAFLAPFLTYLYLPLRAWQGGWVYGDPGTWAGFWAQFMGSEATGFVLFLPEDLAGWRQNLTLFAASLRQQIPAALAALGLSGLVWLTYRRLWVGLALFSGLVVTALFIFIFPLAVWAPAALMPVVALLVAGLAFGLSQLARRQAAIRWLGVAGFILTAIWLFQANRPLVEYLVREPLGREVIEKLRWLADVDLPGGRKVVAIPWSNHYFAAAYGLYVTQELQGFDLVDHRANLVEIVDREGRILTLAFNLGVWHYDWWQERLGTVSYATAAPGVAVISRDNLFEDVPAGYNFPLGNGVTIRQAELRRLPDDSLWLTLYWQAVEPLEANYHVAVHLVAQDPPQQPESLLAQADANNPVGGWYPTLLWQPGEIVRDDYLLAMPPDRPAVAIRATMYQVDEQGNFVNYAWLSLPVP